MRAPLLRLVLIIGFAIILLMAGVASAGPRPGAFVQRRQVPAQPAREAQQVQPAREAAAAENRAATQPLQSAFPPRQRPGTLSPDERRALRRQIDDAAREVYRNGR